MPVPLIHLKFLGRIRLLSCRNFKWAAPAAGNSLVSLGIDGLLRGVTLRIVIGWRADGKQAHWSVFGGVSAALSRRSPASSCAGRPSGGPCLGWRIAETPAECAVEIRYVAEPYRERDVADQAAGMQRIVQHAVRAQ